MRRAKVKQDLMAIIQKNDNHLEQTQGARAPDLETFERLIATQESISIKDMESIGAKIMQIYKGGASIFTTCNLINLEQKLNDVQEHTTSFILCNLGQDHWVSFVALKNAPKPILLYKDSLGTMAPAFFSASTSQNFDIKINNNAETNNVKSTAIFALHSLEVIINHLNKPEISDFINDFSKHKLITLKTGEIQNGWLEYFTNIKNNIRNKCASDLVHLSKDTEFKKALAELIDNIPLENAKYFDEYQNTLISELSKQEGQIDEAKIAAARAKAFDPQLIGTLNAKFKILDDAQASSKNTHNQSTQLEIEQKFPDQIKSISRIFQALAQTKDPAKLAQSIKEISTKLELDPNKLNAFFKHSEQSKIETDTSEDRATIKDAADEKLNELARNLPPITKVVIDQNAKMVAQLLEEMVLPAQQNSNNSSKSIDVKINLAKNLVLVKQFYNDKWHNKTAHDIFSWASSIRGYLLPNDINETIAIMDRANELVTGGHRLRDTQILSILTFFIDNNKGKLCQIQTGEGKTTIVSLIAVIKALQGEMVDVISSNPVLADEAVHEKEVFYALFGLSIDTNNVDANYQEGPRSCYKKNILYGTIGNFQFDYLKDSFLGLGTRGGREFHTIILDEVDSMIIDNASHIAKLSSPFPGMESLKYIYIKIWQALATGEEKVVKNLQEKIQAKSHELEHKDLPELIKQEEFEAYKLGLQEQTIPQIKQLIKDANPLAIHFIPGHIKKYAQTSLDRWIESALSAKFNYMQDEQYQVKDKDGEPVIQPMDYTNTGVTMKNTVWQYGLHQFLQLKHNLNLTTESLTSCFISNLGYINQYQHNKIFGLTGTLGSGPEQDLISTTYQVDYARIPTYKPKKIQELQPLIIDDEDFLPFVALDAREKTAEGRAVLIICETIKELKELKEFLRNYTSRPIKTYSDEESAYIVEEKIDAGEIIIATNIAGRGTDFKTSPALEASGGLHVSIAFLPCNKRVEEQAAGRTGRQGNDGSWQLIIKKSEVIKLGIEAKQANTDNFEQVRELRDQQEQERIKYIQNNKINELRFNDELFAHFSAFYQTLRLKNKFHPEFRYVLEDTKELWAFWLEQKYTTYMSSQINWGALDPREEFEEFQSHISAVIHYSRIIESDNATPPSVINLIQHNPYYAVKQAEYFLQKGKINDAETALKHAIKISENPQILYSAYIKLFEVAIEKGGQLQKRFIKALDEVSFKAASYFIREHYEDKEYKKKAIEYLEQAKGAIKLEQDFLKDLTGEKNQDFVNILTASENNTDKASAGYWYNDADMHIVGAKLLNNINLNTQFKNRLTFDLIKTFCEDQPLKPDEPIFICYNVHGNTSSEGGIHWLAMCVIQTQGQIKLFYKDSKGDFANQAARIEQEFRKYYPNLDFMINKQLEQKDSSSCGLMTLRNLQIIQDAIIARGLNDFIADFTKMKFCSQNEASMLRSEVANFFPNTQELTTENNIFLCQLKSKEAALQLLTLKIDGLVEELSIQEQSMAVGSRCNDYFKNLKPTTDDEKKIFDNFSKSAFNELSTLGANTAYALKEVHDVHNNIVMVAQAQIASGIALIMSSAILAPSAPMLLKMSSVLISEGITDIVNELINQGDQAYNQKNHQKAKMISYGIQLATCSINFLLECPKILQSATNLCKGLSDFLKDKKLNGIFNKLAEHLDQYANWLDRLQTIALYKSKTQIEQLNFFNKIYRDKQEEILTKLGAYAKDFEKLKMLEAAGSLQGTFQFSFKYATNHTYQLVKNQLTNFTHQQITNQIMSKAMNPAFSKMFLDSIKKSVREQVINNLDTKKLATTPKDSIANIVTAAKDKEESSTKDIIIKTTALNVMKNTNNWKAQLTGLTLDLSSEYREVYNYLCNRAKKLCDNINSSLTQKDGVNNNQAEIDSIIDTLTAQLSQEICHKITSAGLKTYQSIDNIKSIYQHYKQAKADEAENSKIIHQIQYAQKEAGQMELRAWSDSNQRPVKIYENGTCVKIIGEKYPGKAIELDYYRASLEHEKAHYVPKGADKHWHLSSKQGGGQMNNCLYDAIAFQTDENPSAIRQKIAMQMKADPETYVNHNAANNPIFKDIMLEGGCTNCHDIEVSDEEYELALPNGKGIIVKKTFYKNIKNITGTTKKIGYAITATGELIMIACPVVGAKIYGAGNIILISAAGISTLNEVYKTGAKHGVISKTMAKILVKEIKENLDIIISNTVEKDTLLHEILTEIDELLKDESANYTDSLKRLQDKIDKQNLKITLNKNISMICDIISHTKTCMNNISGIIEDIKQYKSQTNEIQKYVNQKQPNNAQELMILRAGIEQNGEHKLQTFLTTEELFKHSQKKAIKYYGTRWLTLTDESKTILIAHIAQNNGTAMDISKYNQSNLDTAILEADMRQNYIQDRGNLYPSQRIYSNPLAKKFLAISHNKDGKHLAFCKNDYNKLISQGVRKEDIKNQYKENSWTLKGHDINEMDIDGISSYFGKYTIDAVADILSLYIKSGIYNGDKVQILTGFFISSAESNLIEIIEKSLCSDKEITLVPLDLHHEHAVAFIIEKAADMLLSIKYIDPSNKPIPTEISDLIRDQLPQLIDLTPLTVEQQKYANCGAEVVEDIILYLTGRRETQENAIKMHSRLIEESLYCQAQDDIHSTWSLDVLSLHATQDVIGDITFASS